ncbi:MAG: RNA polymerase sigma factor [Candidatus Doudnabacteria bacterium]
MSEQSVLSDEEIVEKIRLQDQELYSVIMERYQTKLLRYAVSLIKDEHRAADVVQEAFIKAFVNLNGFNSKKKFSSWIYRIVHNEAINLIKKYQKEIQVPENIDFKSKENLEQDFADKEIVAKVEQCFEKMPLVYGEPLRLYYIDEKSYGEISDILRLPMGTVATRINRAKILIKRICQVN